jgi:predicted nucleic acid-binding protein
VISKFIYIDVCALSRPFDDQSYLRIRLETEAVNLILSKVRQNRYKVLVSPVHSKEIESISDPIERIELQTILTFLGRPLRIDETKAFQRAEGLVNLGFGIADAAHVAYAEQSQASFISVDNRLIKQCLRNKIAVWCGNPVAFCEKEEIR